MHPQPGQFGGPPSDLQRMGQEKKMLAGILGILLGGFGVHKFVLGYTTEGLIILGVAVATWVLVIISCGFLFFLPMIPHVIGLVEGIIYLTKPDEEFAQTYLVNKKPWF